MIRCGSLFGAWVVLAALLASGVSEARSGASAAVRRYTQAAPGDTAAADALVDYSALAEAVLGSQWAPRSPSERAQFTELIGELVRAQQRRHRGRTGGTRFQVVGEEPKGDDIRVKTLPHGGDEFDIAVDYVMVRVGGTWKARDIITDNVSLVATYRSQFTKIVLKDGFPVLIQKMRDKIARDTGDTRN